jgi:hypothetical protein
MSAPVYELSEPDVRKLCRNQQRMLETLQAKVVRQRECINRLMAAEEHCVFRIEAELLRQELEERNTEANPAPGAPKNTEERT